MCWCARISASIPRIASATRWREGRHDKAISPAEVNAVVAAEVEKVLDPVAQPLAIDPAHKPFVILVAGVNGSGKTTTIGKLAAKYRAEGRKVMLAAGDTFRAAAIDQLKIWGERTGAEVIAREAGADAAGLVFDAVRAAKERGVDVLLIDTAGRLQNRSELMDELRQGRARDEKGRRRPHRTRCCSCSTRPSARTRCRRWRFSARWPASPGL